MSELGDLAARHEARAEELAAKNEIIAGAVDLLKRAAYFAVSSFAEDLAGDVADSRELARHLADRLEIP